MKLLLTGGAGSFGNAAVEYLLDKDYVEKICIFSRDEFKHEQMKIKFNNNEKLRFWLGDIRDKDRLQLAVNEVDTIIHAAALKIVPNAEYSPFEYIKTNIIGSQNLVDCCINTWQKGTRLRVIALSTDKAVSPLNLYGATKLTMEKLILAANHIHGEFGPRFSIVRYGNVSNSNGSVIPIFKMCKDKGLPLPITDKRMTRFWLLLPEAVEFTMNSLFKMQGAETFIPDMPSFKVIDLAKCFSNDIIEIGIRPGEKLHEEIEIGKSSEHNTAWLKTRHLDGQLRDMGVL